jgi:hypothetical protein
MIRDYDLILHSDVQTDVLYLVSFSVNVQYISGCIQG